MDKLAQDLIATLRESLLVLNHNLVVKTANRSFYRTFQVKPEDVENRFLYELGDGHWNIPELQVALQEIVNHHVPMEDFAVEKLFPRIGYRAMLLNARSVVRDKGAEQLILVAIEDITQQRQAAATIQTYLHKLEWSNRELADFAYIASHDLQEPLRAIQAFSDRLQLKHSQSLNEQGVDYLMRIQKAAGRMRLLISDLLTYSRVTTQAKPFERVDLTSLTQECIEDLGQRIEETGGKVEFGELPVLDADPIQMHQLLQNFLDNGLKFHRDGESPIVKVESHALAPAELMADPLNRMGIPLCFISIEDNGIGFEEKYKDRIFSPFERLHSQNKYPGTGIGLAVCRRIIERHGGTMAVKSTVGQGTTFFIALPLEQSKEIDEQSVKIEGDS